MAAPMHVGIVNNKKFSDVAVVTKDNNTIYTLSAILDVRCPLLYTKEVRMKKGAKHYLENACQKKEPLIVLLHYLYSGYLPLRGCTVDDYTGTWDVAEFLEVGSAHLHNEICRRIYALCTRKTVFKMKAVNTHPLANDVFLCYILDHWDSFSSQKLSDLQETKKKLRTQFKANNWRHSTAVIDPTWAESFETILRKIPNNKPDFVIINDKETDEGLCHGAILAGHSPELALLVENTKDKEYFSSLSGSGIEALLRWLYFGAFYQDNNLAAEILPFAIEFQIHGLIAKCEELLSNCIDNVSVFWILQIILLTKVEKSKLKDLCTAYVVNHLPDLDFENLREMPAFVTQEILIALQQAVDTNWEGSPQLDLNILTQISSGDKDSTKTDKSSLERSTSEKRSHHIEKQPSDRQSSVTPEKDVEPKPPLSPKDTTSSTTTAQAAIDEPKPKPSDGDSTSSLSTSSGEHSKEPAEDANATNVASTTAATTTVAVEDNQHEKTHSGSTHSQSTSTSTEEAPVKVEPVTTALSEGEVKSTNDIKAAVHAVGEGSDTDEEPRVDDSDESSDDITKLMSAATTAAEIRTNPTSRPSTPNTMLKKKRKKVATSKDLDFLFG